MSKLLSTKDVAELIGCDRSTVTRAARALEVGELVGSSLCFTADESSKLQEKISPGSPGNPNIASLSATGVAARQKPN